MKEKTSNKKIFNWSYFLLLLVGIVAINIISAYSNKRLDMTRDKRFSLAQGTVNFLENDSLFSSRMTIKIYLSGKLPAEIMQLRNAIEDKIIEFKQHAGSRIEYMFIDPNEGTDEEKRELQEQLFAQGKGIIPIEINYSKDAVDQKMVIWPGAIINYGSNDVNIIQFMPGSRAGQPQMLEAISQSIDNSINNLEYIMLSSLRKVVVEKKKTIAFLHGNGELEIPATQRARSLISPYFSIRDIEIDQQLNALDHIDGLIIARPTKVYDPRDLFIIDQFVMRGGRLMCFLDALEVNEDTLRQTGTTHSTRYATGLEKMLFDYGMKLNDNLVMDAQCNLRIFPFANNNVLPWYYNVLATPSMHAISRNIEPVSFKYVSEIQFVQSVKDIAVSPILTSSTNSTVTGLAPLIALGLPLQYGYNPQFASDPTSEANKKCIAGIAEGVFTSHFASRIVDEYMNNPDAVYSPGGKTESKVVLVGNGRFIQNAYDSMENKVTAEMMYRPKQFNELRMDEDMTKLNKMAFYGNQEFFQNLVDYAMGDNSVLDIRSRQIDIPKMDKNKVVEKSKRYKIINMVLPSLLVILIAIFMNWRRKKRNTKH